MGNHSIIESIKSNDGEHELRMIYRLYREEFLQLVFKKFGCTPEEGREIFQETVIIFYENIMSGRLTMLTSDVKTYLFGIGKNKTLERKRSREFLTVHDNLQDTEHDSLGDDLLKMADETYETELERVVNSLDQLGDPCRSILVHFYYHNRNMTQIAELLEYKNRDTVKTMKYKCLQKLRSIFDKKPNS